MFGKVGRSSGSYVNNTNVSQPRYETALEKKIDEFYKYFPKDAERPIPGAPPLEPLIPAEVGQYIRSACHVNNTEIFFQFNRDRAIYKKILESDR
ncbi:MAG: hypothetical protein JHC93_08480 [Parachlamydiales bacterium]|nr:hypothetical protein [Parachlamydiales bacterium]